MKNLLLFLLFFFLSEARLYAQEDKIDTVHVGIYITSIHDIDFKDKEFTATFWLWLKYNNPKLDFISNLEIPNAKNDIPFVDGLLTAASSQRAKKFIKRHSVMNPQ